MKHYWFGAASMCLLAVMGCVSTPVRPVPPLVLPELAAPVEVQNQRAREFRELTAGVKTRGVGVYLNAVEQTIAPGFLLDRVAALGANRLYCYVSSEKQLDDFFRNLIAEAARRNIAVEVVLNQRDFYCRATGNKIVRLFRPSYMRLDEAARAVSEFNDRLPPGGKLSGMTVISEPHMFLPTNPDTPPDTLYYWSDSTYGPGLDNAMLMEQTLDMLKKIAAENPQLPVTCGMADFYHELAVEGKLPLGRIGDFCAASPRVMLLDSGNKPSQAAKVVEDELAALPRGSVALVGINLAGHTSVDAGALRRRDWNDLMRGMKHLLGKFQKHPGFEGFVLAPFSALEFVRLERD